MPEWPPIDEPELLRRLALDDAEFMEFIRGVVARLPSPRVRRRPRSRRRSPTRGSGHRLLPARRRRAGGVRGDGAARRESVLASLHWRRQRPPAGARDRFQRGAGRRWSASSPTSMPSRGPRRPRPDRPPARVRRRRRRAADDVRLDAGDPLPQPRDRGRRHHPLGHARPVHPARLVGDHLPPRPAADPLRGRGDCRRNSTRCSSSSPASAPSAQTANRSRSPRSRPEGRIAPELSEEQLLDRAAGSRSAPRPTRRP